MKNFEAYEDKIKELKGEIALNESNELVSCIGFCCRNCKFSNSGNNEYCSKNMFEWLYEEYKKPKVKISLATKYFLESLNNKYKWIAKDENGQVFVYEMKPKKDKETKQWCNGNRGTTYRFEENVFKKELFNFLSWEDEKPTNIKELLENCEVIEDE
jgi:hypothetical protein